MAAPTSPLATLEQCFTFLTAKPNPLAIDGRTVQHGLPARPIPLNELRGLLHDLGPQARTVTLNMLVDRARAGSAVWLVGLAGVLLPGLRQLAAQYTNPIKAATAEAQALTWFCTMIAAHGPVAERRIRWLLDTSCAQEQAACRNES